MNADRAPPRIVTARNCRKVGGDIKKTWATGEINAKAALSPNSKVMAIHVVDDLSAEKKPPFSAASKPILPLTRTSTARLPRC